jgi:hypothetical protein
MLAMGDQKEQMLQKRIERFNQALYWGDAGLAVSYVVPANRDGVYQKAKKSRKSEHYVDLEIQKVDFEDDKESAEVVIDVQFYRTPNYTIQNRTEKQRWVFERFAGGWLLEELSVVSAEPQG